MHCDEKRKKMNIMNIDVFECSKSRSYIIFAELNILSEYSSRIFNRYRLSCTTSYSFFTYKEITSRASVMTTLILKCEQFKTLHVRSICSVIDLLPGSRNTQGQGGYTPRLGRENEHDAANFL